MVLEDDDLHQIYGGKGGFAGILVGLGLLITLIVGIADGFERPLKCH